MFAIIALNSCEDFTEFDRDFLLEEDGSITNVNDLERLLLGTYNSINSYATIVQFKSIASDEVRIGLGNRGQSLQLHSFTLTNNDVEPTGAWNSCYNVIDNVNRLLRTSENLSNPPSESAESILLEQIQGEAYAIRAFQYFDLLRLFAPDFNTTTAGVPLATEVLIIGENDLNIPRSTVGEVLEQIRTDLDLAESLIPNTQTNVNRFSTIAINALRARVELYAGTDYQAAIDAATLVINERPVVTGEDYINMFRLDPVDPDLTTTETIFQIERDQFDGRIGTIWSDVNLDVFFSASIDLTLALLNSAGVDRQNLNIDFETEITERESELLVDDNDIFIGKYLGSAELISANNIKVFRTSEMHLIRAEAYARLNELDLASDDIALLRTQRVSPIVTPQIYGSQEEAFVDILNERRVELAFEGHRLFDLKRFEQGLNRVVEDCSNGDRPSTACDLEANSFRFTFPIPQAEIFANDGISDADQNPGY